MADQIRINGNQLSWGSIKLKIDDDPYFGFSAIVYADKRERVKAYGMGPSQAPRGKSRGKYTTDPVKLTGWKSSIQALREALAARSVDGVSYGNVEFTIIVEYFDISDSPQIVRIEGCNIVGNSSSEEESADPLKEEIEIDCMRIYRNGLTLFDSSIGI